MRTIRYNERDIPVISDKVECIVVGGGTGGAAAAISALEQGLKTLVVEKTISLGGTQTNSLVSPMMPTHVELRSVNRIITERLNQEGIVTSDGTTTCSWFNVESLSYVLEQLITERGGQLLYDANLVDCIREQGRITHIVVNTCGGLAAIEGGTFVDATADAVLSRLAGVPVNSGNEDGHNQQISFRFEMGGINIPSLRSFMRSLGDQFCKIDDPEFYEIAMVPGKGHVLEPLFRQGLADGVLTEDELRYFQAFTQPGKPSVMSFNCPHVPGIAQTTDPIMRSQAVTKGRSMIRRLVRFLPRYIPGFERSYLLKEATQLGIRESYRIVGKYVLNEEDYIRRARFADGIARGDWYIDVHSVLKEMVEKPRYACGEYYEIPYRSLITREISNLIAVGRHISSTFLMQASLRIQPTVRDIGEAAGVACAYSVRHGIELNEIDGTEIKKLLGMVEETA
ncbi:FAD-dependent oxidoreductase [Paenibacillus swuensis]|uniref:FAD-dependent oxidoreductase n=1 Tax=Paenibacillus swuensis TaxID=1178515 RepID=UPI0018D37511|nr:FAD-dependent oxidoreductase [Paenibacillus swuensis]